jgi:hypothetical protein
MILSGALAEFAANLPEKTRLEILAAAASADRLSPVLPPEQPPFAANFHHFMRCYFSAC